MRLVPNGKPRGGDENRVFRLWIDEVAQFRLALRVAAGDAHDIAVVFVAQVFVLVDQCAPHAGGMLLIDAEDDCLLEAVAALLQELGHLGHHQLGPVVDDECAIEILGVVEAVFHLLAVAVGLARLRTVSFYVDVNVDLDHFIRCEEAVLNTLFERIGVDRFAEVVDVRDVGGLLGRGR